jgi:hypothetical protein
MASERARVVLLCVLLLLGTRRRFGAPVDEVPVLWIVLDAFEWDAVAQRPADETLDVARWARRVEPYQFVRRLPADRIEVRDHSGLVWLLVKELLSAPVTNEDTHTGDERVEILEGHVLVLGEQAHDPQEARLIGAEHLADLSVIELALLDPLVEREDVVGDAELDLRITDLQALHHKRGSGRSRADDPADGAISGASLQPQEIALGRTGRRRRTRREAEVRRRGLRR